MFRALPLSMLMLAAAVFLIAEDAEAQNETYYFHSLAKAGNPEGLSGYWVAGMHPFPMDTNPPADPVPATVHPSGVAGTTPHNKYYDVAEWATTTPVTLNGDNLTVRFWVIHGAIGGSYSQALADVQWEVQLYRNAADMPFQTTTINAGAVLPGEPVLLETTMSVTMASGTLSVLIDPVLLEPGADHVILYDSTQFESHVEIAFPTPGGGGGGPGGPLTVDAQGPYETNVSEYVFLDALVSGGTPPYSCLWSTDADNRSKIDFIDPTACTTAAIVNEPGEINVTVDAFDAEGDTGRDNATVRAQELRRAEQRRTASEGAQERPTAGGGAWPTAGSGASASEEAEAAAARQTVSCPVAEPDLDGDGVPDACDVDRDGDSVANGRDNCPDDPNPGQADGDGDGRGDACTSDRDSDGWSDALDNCPYDPNPLQVDLDGDGRGNVCDDDTDGDGVRDRNDAFPLDTRDWRDTDLDGIGDSRDPDIDGDGHRNSIEVAAGSDPYDADSVPQDGRTAEVHEERRMQAQAGLGAWGGLGILVGLVLLGGGLFYLLRRQ